MYKQTNLNSPLWGPIIIPINGPFFSKQHCISFWVFKSCKEGNGGNPGWEWTQPTTDNPSFDIAVTDSDWDTINIKNILMRLGCFDAIYLYMYKSHFISKFILFKLLLNVNTL